MIIHFWALGDTKVTSPQPKGHFSLDDISSHAFSLSLSDWSFASFCWLFFLFFSLYFMWKNAPPIIAPEKQREKLVSKENILKRHFSKETDSDTAIYVLLHNLNETKWLSREWPCSVGAAVCSWTPFTALNISSTAVLLHSYLSSCPVQPAVGVPAGGGAGPHGPRSPYQAQSLCDSMILSSFPQWEKLF